jgi:hypothetical protein
MKTPAKTGTPAKTKIPMGVKAMLVTGGVLGAAAFGACKNDSTGPSDPVCACPDKIHGDKPCDCGLPDCTCVQKEFNYNVDGVKVTVRNDTNADISSYADVINTHMQNSIGNSTFNRALTYFKNNSLDALVIIENEAGHVYDEIDHYRVENDGTTMAIPFELLITAENDSIIYAMRAGFNDMRIKGIRNGYVKVTPATQREWLAGQFKLNKIVKQLAKNSRAG